MGRSPFFLNNNIFCGFGVSDPRKCPICMMACDNWGNFGVGVCSVDFLWKAEQKTPMTLHVPRNQDHWILKVYINQN